MVLNGDNKFKMVLHVLIALFIVSGGGCQQQGAPIGMNQEQVQYLQRVQGGIMTNGPSNPQNGYSQNNSVQQTIQSTYVQPTMQSASNQPNVQTIPFQPISQTTSTQPSIQTTSFQPTMQVTATQPTVQTTIQTTSIQSSSSQAASSPQDNSVILSQSNSVQNRPRAELTQDQINSLLLGLNQNSRHLPSSSLTATVVRQNQPAPSAQELISSLTRLGSNTQNLAVGSVVSGSTPLAPGGRMTGAQRQSLLSILNGKSAPLVRATQFNPSPGVDNLSSNNVVLSQFAPLIAASNRNSQLAGKTKITTEANSVDERLKKFLEAKARGGLPPPLPSGNNQLPLNPSTSQVPFTNQQTTNPSTPQVPQTQTQTQTTSATQQEEELLRMMELLKQQGASSTSSQATSSSISSSSPQQVQTFSTGLLTNLPASQPSQSFTPQPLNSSTPQTMSPQDLSALQSLMNQARASGNPVSKL